MKTEMNDTSMESIKNEPQIMIGGGGEAVIVSSQPPAQQPQPTAPQIQQQSVTGGYQQQHGHGQHHHGGMAQDCTIWMGDLSQDWEESFIREAFGQYSKDIRHVKLVTTQTELGPKRATYCFVEFHDEESARTAILDVNGNPFANDRSYRFNLAFANSPNQMQVEYNLFVNNLAPDVDDVALFRLFGVKYRSCRGAKVYKDEEGRSKEQGFVRFISETDQQRALVEMNKQSFRGRELFLKLARPKTRGTGRYGHGRGGGMGGGHGSHLGGYNQYHGAGIMAGQLPVQMQMLTAGMQYMPGMVPVAPIAVATPYGTQLAPNHGMAGFGTGAALPLPQQQFAGQPYIVGGQSYHQQGAGGYIQSQFPHSIHPGPVVNMMPPMAVPSYQQIVPATQFTQPKQPAVPVYEDVEPLTAEEHNAILLNSNNEFSTALEASRWGPTAFPPDTRKKELPNYLTQQLN